MRIWHIQSNSDFPPDYLQTSIFDPARFKYTSDLQKVNNMGYSFDIDMLFAIK